jgi:hypothetical protein
MNSGIIANIIFVIALVFISIGISRSEALSTPPKEIIKYIPRTLEEEQKNPVRVEKIFKSMFEQQTPWIGSFYDTNVFERRVLDKDRGLYNQKKIKNSIPKRSYNPNVFVKGELNTEDN